MLNSLTYWYSNCLKPYTLPPTPCPGEVSSFLSAIRTGMGLSISYQIVAEKHGGSLSYTSEPGKGAEIQIRIPVCQEISNKHS
ncbi:MAG: ATP-binding protein [Nostoc sp.]